MSGPLAGVKVLDLSRYQNGPHATLMMADYGADILKLEHTQVRCALELRCAPRPSDRVPLRARRAATPAGTTAWRTASSGTTRRSTAASAPWPSTCAARKRRTSSTDSWSAPPRAALAAPSCAH